MKLADLEVRTVERAVGVYLELAYGEEAGAKWPTLDFGACSEIQDVLAGFIDQTGQRHMRKYVMRLGNSRYPFMKLVLQELLIHDSFFFAVDTHDDLDIRSSYQDYKGWLDLKRFNSGLKERIERAWQADDVPTFASIIAEVEAQTPQLTKVDGDVPVILVVDDEADIVRGVVTILNRSGYATRTASSGEEALEMVAEKKPDLILSDLEMGGMTGLDLARRLKADAGLAGVPFILATAATVGSSNFRVIDGYLVKPFDSKILLRFVQQHLGSGKTPG